MFANLKIGTRLTLGFGIVLGLLCLMAAVAAWQIGKLADLSITYADNLVPSFQVEHDISLALADVRRYEFRHVLSDSADRKSTRLNSSHIPLSRMPSSA